MNRCAALPILALSALATLTACASRPVNAAQTQAINARASEAAQVYQGLQLQEVEQEMLDGDKRLTYGYAVVNCGLRSPQWFDMLRYAYVQQYGAVLQVHPLTPEQIAEARDYASAHVSNPSPPPYICQRLATDSSLHDLDYSVAMESLLLAAEKKNTG